jgi:hypothetical protein
MECKCHPASSPALYVTYRVLKGHPFQIFPIFMIPLDDLELSHFSPTFFHNARHASVLILLLDRNCNRLHALHCYIPLF